MSTFLWNNIFKQDLSETAVISKLWKETPLFKGIPKQHIKTLVESMHIRNYHADETVFCHGDQGSGAIMVLEGSVNIMARETLLSSLGEGDFFGEIALAETDKRTVDAVCQKPCKLVFFLRPDLEEWIEVEPVLGNIFLMNLCSVLAQRLQMANQLLAVKES